MELAQQSIKGIPKHILLNSSPCVLSHVLVWVIPLFLCASLFFFCPIGTHRYCLYCPPLTLSSLLVFWVLPLFRCLTVSGKLSSLIFFLSMQCALFFLSSLFSLREGCREEMYVGSTSGLLMCGSDRSVYVGGWVSVCVFTCRSLCVCVWGCIYVEQRYGASEVIRVLVKAPPPQRSFALHLPGFVFLTLSCSSDPFTLCWCLSLAHCCMTVSHQHSPQRAECVPANGGVKAICECLLKNSSSCILFLLFMNLCVRVGGCVPVHVFVVGVKDNLCFAIC